MSLPSCFFYRETLLSCEPRRHHANRHDDIVAYLKLALQGKVMFSLNQYAINNPSVATVKGDDGNDRPANCKELIQSYLSLGMYEGLSGDVGFRVNNQGNL